MALPKKKPDPISDKARALNNEIAALEAEIKKLDTQLSRSPTPKYRSTAMPQGATVPRVVEKPAPSPAKTEPVFEEIKRGPLAPGVGNETPQIRSACVVESRAQSFSRADHQQSAPRQLSRRRRRARFAPAAL
jgi:hypothetical protein